MTWLVFNDDYVYLVWLRVEQVCVLRQRSSEGMMSWFQFLRLLLLGQEKRKVHHPQEVEGRRIPEHDATRLQQLCTLQTKMTQQRALQNRGAEWENRMWPTSCPLCIMLDVALLPQRGGKMLLSAAGLQVGLQSCGAARLGLWQTAASSEETSVSRRPSPARCSAPWDQHRGRIGKKSKAWIILWRLLKNESSDVRYYRLFTDIQYPDIVLALIFDANIDNVLLILSNS